MKDIPRRVPQAPQSLSLIRFCSGDNSEPLRSDCGGLSLPVHSIDEEDFFSYFCLWKNLVYPKNGPRPLCGFGNAPPSAGSVSGYLRQWRRTY